MIRQLIARAIGMAWYLPGLLMWAAFPPMGETMDILFALAPLMYLTRTSDRHCELKRTMWCWTKNAMVFWFATLSWMPAIVKNGGPWYLVALGWGLLAAYCTLFMLGYAYAVTKYWQWTKFRGYGWRILGLLAVEPVLWAGFELLRSRLFGGFAWNHLGVALVNGGFGAPASLGGVYLVSMVVILINGTFASIAERMVAAFRREQLGRWRSVETLAAVLLVLGVYWAAGNAGGATAQNAGNDAQNAEAAKSLGVAMVQRNFPCCFQQRRENPVQAYSNLVSRVAMLKPELVVLSESAMAEFGAIDGVNARSFARYLEYLTGGAAVLAGGGRREDGREYNSAALYQDGAMQIYDKVHLVPFGEYIPGDKRFPALQRFAPVGSCSAGELKLLRLKRPNLHAQPSSIDIGVAICFEDTDGAQMRALARKGAQVLVFITNDSWFSNSDEAVQHAWQARARAIETGLTVVRVGNSGVTGVIAPNGRPVWLVNERGKPLVDREGTMFDRIEVSAAAAGTWYVRLGDWPLIIVFVLLIGTMIMIKYINYGKRRALSLQIG